MKAALFIIDMQKEYYKGGSRESMDRAAKNINAAVDLFRRKNFPVVWIQNEREGNAFTEENGHEIISALDYRSGETDIYKRYKNSFNKTPLLDFVAKNSIDTVIISGYSAAYCVLSTYRAAEDHDLTPILLKGGIAGNTEESVKFVESISDTVPLKVMEKFLSLIDAEGAFCR